MFNVGIILLAAGNSSRMGSTKQLMNFNGKPLLQHAAEVACRCDCAPVIVVLGSRQQDMRPALKELPLEVAINESWLDGIGTSIKAGLHALGNRDVSGVTVALADQPFIGPRALRRLAELHGRTQKRIVASRYSETVGPPAFFSRELFPHLLALEPHQGCKAILLASQKDALLIDCPEGAIDIDTPMDYARLGAGGLSMPSSLSRTVRELLH